MRVKFYCQSAWFSMLFIVVLVYFLLILFFCSYFCNVIYFIWYDEKYMKFPILSIYIFYKPCLHINLLKRKIIHNMRIWKRKEEKFMTLFFDFSVWKSNWKAYVFIYYSYTHIYLNISLGFHLWTYGLEKSIR